MNIYDFGNLWEESSGSRLPFSVQYGTQQCLSCPCPECPSFNAAIFFIVYRPQASFAYLRAAYEYAFVTCLPDTY